MKKICTCSSVQLLQIVQAQKTEVSIGVNGNLSFFRGSNALASTYAIGLTNYYESRAGINPEAYVSTGRLGVFLRL